MKVLNVDSREYLIENPEKYKAILTSLDYTDEDTFRSDIRLCMNCIDDDGYIIFVNTDEMRDNSILSKSYLIIDETIKNDYKVLFHKIAHKYYLKAAFRQINFSHIICITKTGTIGPQNIRIPDVSASGRFCNRISFGEDIVERILKYFIGKGITKILDPFCGYGTSIIVGKKLGLEVVGLEINKKICRSANHRISHRY